MFKLRKEKSTIIYSIVAFLFVFGGFFLHFYKLGFLPNCLNVDEAGLWYNVKCLLNWGVDQREHSWPLLLANMWGEQSPMYTYLALLCVKIWGDTLFAIRIPAFVNTVLVLIFGYKITEILFKNDKITLLFIILWAITPYFTIISKMALDCNLMLGLSTMFLYFFFKSLETRKIVYYLFAGVSCGLTFYTYALSYLIIPIFLVLSLVYLLCYKKILVKEILAFCIPAILLGIPLLLVQIINIFELNEIVLYGITFTNFDTDRNGEFSFAISNIGFNLICSILYIFKGLNKSIYNIPGGYLLYVNSVLIVMGWIFMIINLIKSIKNKEFSYFNLILFWAISIIAVLSVLNAGRDVYQQCAIYFVYIIFAIYSLLELFKKMGSDNAKKIFIIVVAIIYLVSFAQFAYFYFVNYDEFASETKLMAAEVPEQIHELDGTTYFLKNYVYYQATYGIRPSEFREMKTITSSFTYNDIVFNYYIYPETIIDESCNYVIYYKDFETMSYFEGYNFEKQRIGDYIFYLPIT